MSTTVMEVPESQRLIAVSLGKIAASRSQKGGINLHKNLLVATVLHKARTAYMIQHFARQRTVNQTSPPPDTTTTTTTQPPSVEMRDQQRSSTNNVSDSSPSSSSSSVSSSPSPASTTAVSAAAAAPTFHAAPTVTGSTHSASVDATPETGSMPDGADVSAVQVAEYEDKENAPPLTSTSCAGDATLSPHCEKRLHGDCVAMHTQNKDSKEAPLSSSSSPPRSLVVSHALNNTRQDYVSSNSRKCGSNTSSSSSCLLKRRRTMDSNHENVSAPKVRIVEARLSVDSNPEPMQCDSPQISNLVNIFNTSFAGLSGTAGGDVSVRSVGQSLLSAGHKMLSDNMTCGKEMKMGLDSSVRPPLVLSV